MVSEIYKEALTLTNERLNELNMLSFNALKKGKERYPKEYNIARKIFEVSLKKILNKYKTEVINKLELVMEAFNDNF